MKSSILLLSFLFSIPYLSAKNIDVDSEVSSVTLYHSGALVNRELKLDLSEGLHELTLKNISSKIVMNSLKIDNREITVLNKQLIKKLTKEEFNKLLDRKEALHKQMTLIENKYNEEGFVSKVEDLEKMTDFYARKILQIKTDLRNIDEQIVSAKKFETIVLENNDAAILKLVISVEKSTKSPITMKYVCGGIGWSPSYDIIADNSSDNKLNLKYMARAMSQTGENWENITVHLSSSFPLESPTSLPQVQPWTLSGNQSDYQMHQNSDNNVHESTIDKLEGIEYQEIRIPSFLEVRTLKGKFSLKSNSTVFTFPILQTTLPADFYYYGFPGLDPETYLVAEVTGWDTLGFVDGVANIIYRGNDIGKSIIKFSEAKDTLQLPIGKDNSVFMKRVEISDQKYAQTTSVSKKKKTTMAYRYELKNNNPFAVKFELIDQVPISQTKSAEVDVEEKSNADLNGETGELYWHLALQPSGSVEKKLIYTIETEQHYNYFKGKAHYQFRTISCPSF